MPSRLQPPRLKTDDDRPRQIGVELELGGLEIPVIARLVADVFGGSVERVTEYEYRVETGGHGTFRVEADLELLRQLGTEAEADATSADSMRHRVLAAFGEMVAPVEVVGPPLPFTSLELFDELVARLYRRGGSGSATRLLAAYGAQLNPEAPSLEVDSVTAHLRAFALIYDWLAHAIDVDLSRRVTPFVDPYPTDYVLLLAAPDYRPDLGELIDDYLAANPTRNRALDMLPLFAHLDPERVARGVDDPRIKSRPAYHYRLPDSRVHVPGWSITEEWQRWLAVERVAADAQLTALLSHAFCDEHASVVDRVLATRAKWAERCADLLAPLWDA